MGRVFACVEIRPQLDALHPQWQRCDGVSHLFESPYDSAISFSTPFYRVVIDVGDDNPLHASGVHGARRFPVVYAESTFWMAVVWENKNFLVCKVGWAVSGRLLFLGDGQWMFCLATRVFSWGNGGHSVVTALHSATALYGVGDRIILCDGDYDCSQFLHDASHCAFFVARYDRSPRAPRSLQHLLQRITCTLAQKF